MSIDLESKIMDCWNIIDDMKVLTEGVLEKDLSKDQISNVLIGLETLYQLKFEKLFDEYSKMIRENAQKD
jgi:hypothetical protein